MSCKDCQCSKNIDQTLAKLDITENNQCKCTSCNASNIPETSGCSCCRPPASRRNCRCCPCRTCCGCCSCCSTRGGGCSGRKQEQISIAKKEEEKPKPAEEVVQSCKCCVAKEEVKPKKVCAGCGCDKCT